MVRKNASDSASKRNHLPSADYVDLVDLVKATIAEKYVFDGWKSATEYYSKLMDRTITASNIRRAIIGARKQDSDLVDCKDQNNNPFVAMVNRVKELELLYADLLERVEACELNIINPVD